MNLYLKIKNGQPDGHPVQQDNLAHAFPNIDLDNLPEEWANFKRVQPPTPGIFQRVNDWGTYIEIDGVWQDSWVITDMSQEEKDALIARFRADPPFPNAILNIENLTWNKPEKPTDGQNYIFNPSTGTWVVVPIKPDDGKRYRFSWFTMNWVESNSDDPLIA